MRCAWLVALAGCATATTIRVPAGAFAMGSDDALVARELDLCRRYADHPETCTPERFALERPMRTIALPAFRIDRDEVTNAAYERCRAGGGCPARDFARCETFDLPGLAGGVPDGHPLRAPDRPAVCVSAAQAEAFCRWRGGRLPTEEEWEKAARGPTPRLFPWGDAWDETVTNWGDEVDGAYGARDGHAWSAPAGSFPRDASPYGVRDMGGNVWEWTGGVLDGKRVTRGGGFVAKPMAFTTAHRAPQPATRVAVNIGFRCAYDATGS